MEHIIIYTKQETLDHKKELTGCYWDLAAKPKRELKPWESQIYFATKGSIRGSFTITKVIGQTIFFDDWEDLDKPVPQKPFRGFKYFSSLEEELSESLLKQD